MLTNRNIVPAITRNQKGVSLIEVMVAALVLGVGLLGVLSLQGRSLQYGQQSYLFSQASILAQDMAERMMANPTAASKYKLKSANGAKPSAISCAAGCTPDQLAAADLANWQIALADILPGASAEIVSLMGANGEYYIITVKFRADRDSKVDGEDSVRLVVNP